MTQVLQNFDLDSPRIGKKAIEPLPAIILWLSARRGGSAPKWQTTGDHENECA
jgi:hypothetical protein